MIATVIHCKDSKFRWHIFKGNRLTERSVPVYSSRRAARRGIMRAQPTIDRTTIRYEDHSTREDSTW